MGARDAFVRNLSTIPLDYQDLVSNPVFSGLVQIVELFEAGRTADGSRQALAHIELMLAADRSADTDPRILLVMSEIPDMPAAIRDIVIDLMVLLEEGELDMQARSGILSRIQHSAARM